MCTKCKNEKGLYQIGEDTLCDGCLEVASLENAHCPNCGEVLNMQAEQVSMTLSRPNSTSGMPVLIMVCPKCHVLFMDKFQYNVLKRL